MEARVRTAFDAHGLLIAERGGATRKAPYWAGALHYWRVDPSSWKACLRAIADLGVPLVEAPVPWGVHELPSGRHDWTGPRDLARFLGLAAEAGLDVVLRPGPCVGAELTYLGLPERLLRDGDVLARAAHGGPAWLPAPPRAFPVPSYASARFHDQVRDWFGVMAEVVRPHVAPDGPVVALGVDADVSLFYRLGAYDLDYHPDAIAWWHEDGGDGDPPRAWDAAHPTRCIRWVRFKERYAARALGRFSAALDEVGLAGVARLHHLAPGDPGLGALVEASAAIGGAAGVGVRASRRHLDRVRRRALHTVGSQELPLAPAVGLGGMPWLPPIDGDGDRERARDTLLAVLAAGVRGFGLETLVERERGLGGAIDGRGHEQPDAAWIRALLAALREVDWTSLRRRTPIALVLSRADLRVALASSVIDPVTPVVADFLGLGPGGAAELGRDPAGALYRRWFAAVEDALTLAEIPYVVVDEACPVERLRGFTAVVAPTLDRVDRALWRHLKVLAEERRVVVFGPDAPTHDELGRPLGDDAAPPKRAGRIRAASLGDGNGLAEDLAGLAGDPPDAWLVDHPDDIDCAAFADEHGETRAVFVVSRAATTETAELVAPDDATLRDPFHAEVLTAGNGRIRVRMAAGGVRMFIVERAISGRRAPSKH